VWYVEGRVRLGCSFATVSDQGIFGALVETDCRERDYIVGCAGFGREGAVN
jgi:hypothetical protein